MIHASRKFYAIGGALAFLICWVVFTSWTMHTQQTAKTSSTAPTTVQSTPATWWNNSWKHRKKLTFFNQNQTEELANFPVLVHLTENNFDFTRAKTAGEDIRFIDADDETELPYEVELWDRVKKEAFIWVSVPKLDPLTNSDFIYLYSGNNAAQQNQKASEVWNDSYLVVWHFNDQNGSTSIQDSTKNKHHGTRRSVNGPLITQGLIGYGQSFNADRPDYIQFPTIPPQKVPLTLSFLMNPTEKYPYVEGIYDSAPGYGVNAFRNFFYRSAYEVAFFEWWNFAPNIYVIPRWNDWNNVIVGYYFDKVRKMNVYHDGVNHDNYVRANTNSSPAVGWSTFTIGSVIGEAGSSYDGMLDEFRIATATRSASYATAENATFRDQLINYDQPTLAVTVPESSSSKTYIPVHFSYASLLPKRELQAPADNLYQVYFATPSARVPLFFTEKKTDRNTYEGILKLPLHLAQEKNLIGVVEEVKYGKTGLLPTHFQTLPTNFENSGNTYPFTVDMNEVGAHLFEFDNVSTQAATVKKLDRL